MQEKRRKFVIFLGAILLAAIIVVGSLLWLTGSLFTGDENPEVAQEPEEIVETQATPEPTTIARITPEAASTEPLVQEDMSEISGVTTTAQTGPAETALVLFGLLSALGLSGSLFLIKFA